MNIFSGRRKGQWKNIYYNFHASITRFKCVRVCEKAKEKELAAYLVKKNREKTKPNRNGDHFQPKTIK